MRVATVYKRGGVLYFHSSSKTTAGVWIATPPFARVLADTTNSAKGELVLQTLDSSRDGVPHPTNWKGIFDPLLELAGVKTWATFMKNSVCVALEFNGERLKLIPNRNLGPKEGFEPVLANAIELPQHAGPDEIGSALENLLI